MLCAFFILAAPFSPPAGADCITEVVPNSAAPFNSFRTVFPNWVGVPASTFLLIECDDVTCAFCTDSSIVSLTILNYGTAMGGPGGDISNLYFQIVCGSKINTGTIAMTYSGQWTVGTGTYSAWTWNGPFVLGGDPCDDPSFGCWCNMNLNLYADISPCPVDGRTLSFGIGSNFEVSPTLPGGLVDTCNCSAPWSITPDPDFKTIRYAIKSVDKDILAPGDTLNYSLYYGLPGTNTPSQIVVFDSLPEYTHYIPGSAYPPPDIGWEPEPGPPMRLRWSLSTTQPTTGGATNELKFSVSVDWGMESCIDPLAGDKAAPELFRIYNATQVFWEGSSCGPGTTAVTPRTQSVVRRYLFWKLADNDALMAPYVNSPDDEIVYELFVKNVSASKTWYNVRIWDTVPPELDSWVFNCGFWDPCLGSYTMTPTGCSAGSPGNLPNPEGTLLTWNFDLLPQQTMEVKWKAAVRNSTPSGGMAVNIASIQAMGADRCFKGATGDAIRPRIYTHVAPILLRTMYNTYLTNFANALDWGQCWDYGFWIAFYPLNKNTEFTLFRREHIDDTFANDGGVSLPINIMTGTCSQGFPGNVGGTGAGCGPNRAPAIFKPDWWWGINCVFPYGQLFKLVANSALIWEYDMEAGFEGADGITFTGSTSLSFCGFTHYTSRRSCCGRDDIDGTVGDWYGWGDAFIFFNTGMLPDDTFDPTRPTTLHLFMWDGAKYAYQQTVELDGESLWMDDATFYAQRGHWKFSSSDTKLIVNKRFHSQGERYDNNFSGGRDFGHIAPFRKTGNLVSLLGDDTSYFVAAGPRDPAPNLIVGNVGDVTATYEIWKYMPNFPSMDGTDGVPMYLGGTSGYWLLLTTDFVRPGLKPVAAMEDNPHPYGPVPGIHQGIITTQPSGAYKIKVLEGGPIQIVTGDNAFSGYSGGTMLHAAKPVGEQTGNEFWITQTFKEIPGECEELYTFVVACPAEGTVVRFETTGDVTARYTTDAPDECVSFQKLTTLKTGKHNYRMTLEKPGNVIGQYLGCEHGDAKFFTAPFLKRGTFYTILAPPVVFAGQPFWLTVVVTSDIGTTKTEYCGMTDFTSTDPGTVFPSSPVTMDPYQWSSSTGCPLPPPYDDGVKLFVGVQMFELGSQAIVASDTVDGTITGLVSVTVVGANVKFTKEPRLALASSGDIVSFRICWSNYASSSAFDFTITDAVPMGTDFVAQTADDTKCSIPAGVAVDTAYSTVTPPVYSTTTGLIPPGTRWLKWTVNEVGVNSSGCVCFRLSVN